MSIATTLKDLSKDLLGVLDKSLNPRVGLINSIMEEKLPERTGLGLRLMHAVISPPTYYRKNALSNVKTTERGSGAAFTRESATWAAIGEGLERYAASIYWPDQLIEASANELGDTAIGLKTLIVTGRSEVRLFNPAVRRRWVKGRALATNREAFVPAAMTYLGYERQDEAETLSQNDSTGLACNTSYEAACRGALCEVIERDAFASTWLLSRRPPRLMVAGALDRLDLQVQLALKDSKTSVRLFYLAQSFGVHVVMCVVEGSQGIGAVGASASPFIIKAIEKAVAEGLHSWVSGSAAAGRKKIGSLEDIKGPTDHLFYYLAPERFSVIKDLCSADTTISLVDLLEAQRGHVTADDIAIAMASDGFEAVAVDLTTADVAALGMSVVRAIVPGLQPLIFGSASVLAPDQRRLNFWRAQWRIHGAALNPHPHPFP